MAHYVKQHVAIDDEGSVITILARAEEDTVTDFSLEGVKLFGVEMSLTDITAALRKRLMEMADEFIDRCAWEDD